MAEEEVMAEVEAVQAVYGDDCQVIEAYPPHLHVHLKPRTADVSSQQFVEATIGIQAGPQYPEETPEIRVIDSKGLDDKRQKHLIDSISCKAFELASCLMLVALCEEAVEKLSSMNHPDGNCPLCLWWNWMQLQSETEISSSSSSTPPASMPNQRGITKMMDGRMGMCPVCRKVFLDKDIEHVLDLVGTVGDMNSNGIEIDSDLVHSDAERKRKEKFEAILKIQQENSGLIEPKKSEVLLPGMFLPQPVSVPSADSDGTSSESRSKDPAPKSDNNPGSSHSRPPGSSHSRPGPKKHHNSNMRKHRTHNSSKQARQWIRKDNVSEN